MGETSSPGESVCRIRKSTVIVIEALRAGVTVNKSALRVRARTGCRTPSRHVNNAVLVKQIVDAEL